VTAAGEVALRRATAADLDALARLRWQFTFEDEEPGELRDDYERAFRLTVGEGIESGRWHVFVADAGGEVVAHMYVGLIEKVPRPVTGPRWLGYLTNVYTVPAWRGLGVGTRLLREIQEWCRAESVELLVVWPSEESVELYRRLGFERHWDPLVWLATV
jgi:ribosomal protein S18 acetylase RimI-like enzyme